MKDLKQRMLDILNETAQHYNSNNRSNQDGHCTYIPLDPTKSEGCAIVRKLPKASLAFIMEVDLNNGSIIDLTDKTIPLGRVLKGLPIDFLEDLQLLHDNDFNWIGSGLSQTGVKKVSFIENSVNNGRYDY